MRVLWIAILLAITTFLAAGCVVLAQSSIDRDRNSLHAIQSKLICGMTIAQIEVHAGKGLEIMNGSPGVLTHIARREFANLWIVVETDGLKSSQIHFIDGLTSYAAEPRLQHCKSESKAPGST